MDAENRSDGLHSHPGAGQGPLGRCSPGKGSPRREQFLLQQEPEVGSQENRLPTVSARPPGPPYLRHGMHIARHPDRNRIKDARALGPLDYANLRKLRGCDHRPGHVEILDIARNGQYSFF